ncbi:unnamed protein product [Schistosoma rodhaini]|nr:unnamed protein product [Schistosoma rodhaini]
MNISPLLSRLNRICVYALLPFDFILKDSQLNLYSNVIRKEWSLYTLNTSYLPIEAYYSVELCYIAPKASIWIDNGKPNE